MLVKKRRMVSLLLTENYPGSLSNWEYSLILPDMAMPVMPA